MVKQLASGFHTRIQMHQVGARDEARLVADFETCGQECCCRQFLKVLKPVNMGSAKIQKATLDPNKISGRCGRLKCCLRYEDATYDELRRKLPRIGTKVRTPDGVGIVEETTILTQLVKIRYAEDRVIAIANEEILERDVTDEEVGYRPRAQAAAEERPEAPPPRRSDRRDEEERREPRPPRESRPPRKPRPQQQQGGRPEAVPQQQPRPRPQPPQRPSRRSEGIGEAPEPFDASASPASGDGGGNPQQPPSPDGSQQQGMGSLGRRRRRRGRGR